jgi:putative intracellular protease/amidase
MKKILVPLPSQGSDPSEVAIPCLALFEKGYDVVFSTPDGRMAVVDQRMLTGKGLGLLKSSLAARTDAVNACLTLQAHSAFINPIKYQNINSEQFDGIYLPGGHDKTVKPYLESVLLQQIIVEFFQAKKMVAAVCHGVVLVSRSINPSTKKSVIHDFKTTELLNIQEKLAYQLTRWWLGEFYLTYPNITVEDEVTSALASPTLFFKGPLPLFRDSKTNLSAGFVVKDRNYLSARWPGDIYNLSSAMIKFLNEED